jgi:hypothetical protein
MRASCAGTIVMLRHIVARATRVSLARMCALAVAQMRHHVALCADRRTVAGRDDAPRARYNALDRVDVR